jgi:SPASM domain peptide maturase of grasp-with-spasm system
VPTTSPSRSASCAALLDEAQPALPEDLPFVLYPSCIPVAGARRSTICDLQREEVHPVPNGLYELLTEHRGRTLREVQEAYGRDCDDVIEEYFRYLLRNDLGFWGDGLDTFPALDLTWDTPEVVTNAIVDCDGGSDHPWEKILVELDELGCTALQIRCYSVISLESLEAVLDLMGEGRLRSVDLLLRWDPSLLDGGLEALCDRHPRVTGVFVHSAPRPTSGASPRGTPIHFRTDPVTSETHCGQVHPAYFAPTLSNFTESQAHNSCLNRKLGVDARGEIRNCPSMPRSYGNVRDTSIHDAVDAPAFSDWWSIDKSQVEVCRDCEFRYVCTDCRAYVRSGGGRYEKPARCAYDPYTAEWA